MSHSTDTSPDGPTATTALFALVWFTPKLIVEVDGEGVPAGKSCSQPADVACVTVTLRETAWAPDGMPQSPVRTKVRVKPAASAGASVVRVSIIRQGATE